MDYTILYVIGFAVLAIGLIFGVTYLRKNNQVDEKTLELVVNALGLSVAVVDELNLKNEDKILYIGNIIVNSLKYAQDVLHSSNKDELVSNATAYAYKLCVNQGIELTDSRKLIIDSLIKLSVINMK